MLKNNFTLKLGTVAMCSLLCAVFRADAAPSVRIVGGGVPSSGTAAPVANDNGGSSYTPGASGAARIGSARAASVGTARAASAGAARVGTNAAVRSASGSAVNRNSIGRYLGNSANYLNPGSSIKAPGSGGDTSGLADAGQVDDLEKRVDELEDNKADSADVYTKAESDALLGDKQDLLIAGEGVSISPEGVISVDGVGTDGREVELRSEFGYIQWKYADDTIWTDLVALSELKGDDGAAGAPGEQGESGSDGKSSELRVETDYIQWRQTGGEWQNLIPLSALKGADGDSADLSQYSTTAEIGAMITNAINNASSNYATYQQGLLAETALQPGQEADPTTSPGPELLTSGNGEYVLGVEMQGSTIVRKWIKVY